MERCYGQPEAQRFPQLGHGDPWPAFPGQAQVQPGQPPAGGVAHQHRGARPAVRRQRRLQRVQIEPEAAAQQRREPLERGGGSPFPNTSATGGRGRRRAPVPDHGPDVPDAAGSGRRRPPCLPRGGVGGQRRGRVAGGRDPSRGETTMVWVAGRVSQGGMGRQALMGSTATEAKQSRFQQGGPQAFFIIIKETPWPTTFNDPQDFSFP